jgi:hypothetical protein
VPEPDEILSRIRQCWLALGGWFAVGANRWLAAVLILSAVARLTALELAPFGPEQARWLASARLVAWPGAHEALASPQVQPGLLTATLALALPPSGDARPALMLLALLQMGALLALGLYVARTLSATVGSIAIGLLGLGPWAVLTARNLTPDALTFTLSLLLLAALLAAVTERNGWAWAVSALVTTLAVANDPRALSLGLVWLGAIIFYYDRVRWAHLAVGAALAALVAWSLGLSGALLASLQAGLASPEQGALAEHILNAGRQTAQFVAGRGLGALASPSEPGAWATLPLLDRLRQLIGLLFWVALPWSAVQAFQSWAHWRDRNKGPERTLLALWLWLPLLLAPRLDPLSGGITSLLAAPAAAVAIGLLVSALQGQLQRSGWAEWRWGWLALLIACGLTLAGNLYSAVALPRFAADHDAHVGYGTPYRLWRLTESLVTRATARAEADQLWVYAPPSVAETAHILLDGATFLSDSGQLLPAGRPGLYLHWAEAPATARFLERLGSREIGRVAWPDGTQAIVYELRERPAAELLGMIPQRANVRFDAGLHLVGYDWPGDVAPGQEALLVTYWTMADFSSRDQQTAHTVSLALQADSGQQYVWSGPLALDGVYWQEGLLLRQESMLALPANWPSGPAHLLAEVRRGADGTPAPILDATARPGHTTAELGIVNVN